MPLKGKARRNNASANKKFQQAASVLQESTNKTGIQESQTNSSLPEEKAMKDITDTAVPLLSQQVQEASSIEQCTLSEEKPSCSLDSLTDCKSNEKSKPEERPSNSIVDEDMTSEKEPKGKSNGKKVKPVSSPLDMLKWKNKKAGSETKRGRKKEKKNEEVHSRQTAMSEYFSVRRSDRKCKSAIQKEKQKALEEALLSGREDGLEVREVEGKGRGVFSTKAFSKGQFVCEYAGELIDYKTAKEREQFYEGKTEYGCYMYYFNFKNKKLCVDATKESGRLGRLLNHSKTEANCATKLVCVQDTPHLILETIQDVSEGEELLYDYGERSKDVIQHHQWLKS